MSIISKQEFSNIINKMKKIEELSDAVNQLIRENDLENDFFDAWGIFNFQRNDSTLKLLRTMFDDKDNWIEYFIYELNYGQNWKIGMVTCPNEKGEQVDIRLDTTEGLYDFLIANQKGK